MKNLEGETKETASVSSIPKKGVVYISRIPPYMNVHKLRSYMEQFGKVDRIFLTPEDNASYKLRVKLKGCKKMKYIDGWVEFSSRKIAQLVAESLNNQPLGGKKRRNFWREDIWNIKYLKKFQWHHLTELSVYQRNVRNSRLKAQFSKMQKSSDFYLQQVEKSRRLLKQAERKKKMKEGKKDDVCGSGDAIDGEDVNTLKRTNKGGENKHNMMMKEENYFMKAKKNEDCVKNSTVKVRDTDEDFIEDNPLNMHKEGNNRISKKGKIHDYIEEKKVSDSLLWSIAISN